MAVAIGAANFLSSADPCMSALPHQRKEASSNIIANTIIQNWIRRLCLPSSTISCLFASASCGVSLSMVKANFLSFDKASRSIVLLGATL